MKTSKTVRRFDDLGRIIIPREIRKRLEIREGQAMEILTDSEGRIILQKHASGQQEE